MTSSDPSPSPSRWVAAAAVPGAERLATAAGVDPRMATLLARRGVDGSEAARRFLDPRPEDLHDPRQLTDLDAALERLERARADGDRVVVVGDYDVDGVTGTALLLVVLRACGLEAEAIVPHRLREGYGFQPVHVEKAVGLGARVVVTVDCGTTSVAAAEAAREAGLDVIVTDHHLPDPERPLPEGVLLVNPHRPDCGYPFESLSGAGLAFQLARALGTHFDRPLPLDALLRVACLGTIADMVPLVGENRTIAALGLEALGRVRSPGLVALIERSGMKSPPYTASDVGFRIGPRINAVGRLDDATKALELLLLGRGSRDRERARELAEELDTWNQRRRDREARVVDEAREAVEARPGDLPPVLVAWSEEWHRGVVGIAAGRLARRYHRPVILLSVDRDEGHAVGSGRSIPSVPLHAFLEPWREHLLRFGGHAQAVGLSVALDHLEPLRQALEEAAGEWDPEALVRTHEYELEVAPEDVGPQLLEELARLEPHGTANPRPLLKVGPLELLGAPRRFGRGHLSAMARGAVGRPVSMVGWNWGERADDLDGRFEVLGHLEEDRYRGGPRLRLVDARPAG